MLRRVGSVQEKHRDFGGIKVEVSTCCCCCCCCGSRLHRSKFFLRGFDLQPRMRDVGLRYTFVSDYERERRGGW